MEIKYFYTYLQGFHLKKKTIKTSYLTVFYIKMLRTQMSPNFFVINFANKNFVMIVP